MTTHTKINLVESAGRCFIPCSSTRGLMSPRGWILAAGILLATSVAQAQVVVGPVAGPGYWGGGVGTADSAWAHGAADVIRSEGVYNMYTSQAMIQVEEARSKNLINRRKATENYFAGKELYQADQARKRERNKSSAEALNKAAQTEKPAPLGPATLNPESGKITWPKLLLDSRYATKRAELDKLFQKRASTSSTADQLDKIQTATGEMIALLKGNISKLPAKEYMQARKFLDSLAFTAGQS
jgi:hypothetical protein